MGIRVVRSDEDEAETGAFDFVVAGLDRNFNYQTLHRAQQAIFRGGKFIATNRDGQFPIEGGQTIPGGGAMVAALEACTDVIPLVIGKPEISGLQTILTASGVAAAEAVMIGDRLDTDILCGKPSGRTHGACSHRRDNFRTGAGTNASVSRTNPRSDFTNPARTLVKEYRHVLIETSNSRSAQSGSGSGLLGLLLPPMRSEL